MVNISQAIIKWLNKFKEQQITTDTLGSETVSYGLFKAPTQNVKKDILGNVTCSDYYTFMVRMDNVTDNNMIRNQEWMQSLTDWIEEQNNIRNYPDLEEYECTGIMVSSPFYMGQAAERSAVYQLTINIKYRKENYKG